jgi:NAD+ diphosphatase
MSLKIVSNQNVKNMNAFQIFVFSRSFNLSSSQATLFANYLPTRIQLHSFSSQTNIQNAHQFSLNCFYSSLRINYYNRKQFFESNTLNKRKCFEKNCCCCIQTRNFNGISKKANSNLFKRVYISSSLLTIKRNLTYLLNKNRIFNYKLEQDGCKVLLKSQMDRSSVINYFAHSFIDRCSDRRKDIEWINSQLKNDNTIFILFHVDKPFVSVDTANNMFSLTRFKYKDVKTFLEPGEPNGTSNHQSKNNFIFLGLEYEKVNSDSTDDDAVESAKMLYSPYSYSDSYNKNSAKAWFAIDTSNFDSNIEKIQKIFPQHGQFFEGNFLRLMAIKDIQESSIIAQARSIFCWIDRHKFCASCGHQNELGDSGFKLECKNLDCKSNNKALNKIVPSNIHYPRVDPVVIMLIVNPAKTHLLLGRKRQFPKNMFSCLAGFIEAGESIEEAVRRESYEESGIYTDHVVYHSSQPWPFPSTLMIGCLAYATSTEINIDNQEIEEARWFSLDEVDLIVKGQHPDKITIPSERTIANQLISYWIKNRSKL